MTVNLQDDDRKDLQISRTFVAIWQCSKREGIDIWGIGGGSLDLGRRDLHRGLDQSAASGTPERKL
jgi:hypothetical protein